MRNNVWYCDHVSEAQAALDALKDARWCNEIDERHIRLINAVRKLMPCDDADGAIEGIADDLAHGVRVAVEYADPDATFWTLADVHHDARRGVWL